MGQDTEQVASGVRETWVQIQVSPSDLGCLVSWLLVWRHGDMDLVTWRHGWAGTVLSD